MVLWREIAFMLIRVLRRTSSVLVFFFFPVLRRSYCMPKETKKANTSRAMNTYGAGLEANTLAMLDSTGAKDNRDANEDRS